MDKVEQLSTYDPARTAEIMQRKGWHKDEDGFWSKDGTRLKIVVDVFPNLFQDFTPVLIEQLRQAGFDASFRATNDAYTRMTQGTARAFVMGHAASVRDPYFTLRLYHSRFVQPTAPQPSTSGVGEMRNSTRSSIAWQRSRRTTRSWSRSSAERWISGCANCLRSR